MTTATFVVPGGGRLSHQWSGQFTSVSCCGVDIDVPSIGLAQRTTSATNVRYRRHLFWRYSLVWTKPS